MGKASASGRVSRASVSVEVLDYKRHAAAPPPTAIRRRQVDLPCACAASAQLSLVHLAAANGQPGLLGRLLDEQNGLGAAACVADATGATPLHHAIRTSRRQWSLSLPTRKQQECVAVLLAHCAAQGALQASCAAPDRSGLTPWMEAQGDKHICALFAAAGYEEAVAAELARQRVVAGWRILIAMRAHHVKQKEVRRVRAEEEARRAAQEAEARRIAEEEEARRAAEEAEARRIAEEEEALRREIEEAEAAQRAKEEEEAERLAYINSAWGKAETVMAQLTERAVESSQAVTAMTVGIAGVAKKAGESVGHAVSNAAGQAMERAAWMVALAATLKEDEERAAAVQLVVAHGGRPSMPVAPRGGSAVSWALTAVREEASHEDQELVARRKAAEAAAVASPGSWGDGSEEEEAASLLAAQASTEFAGSAAPPEAGVPAPTNWADAAKAAAVHAMEAQATYERLRVEYEQLKAGVEGGRRKGGDEGASESQGALAAAAPSAAAAAASEAGAGDGAAQPPTVRFSGAVVLQDGGSPAVQAWEPTSDDSPAGGGEGDDGFTIEAYIASGGDPELGGLVRRGSEARLVAESYRQEYIRRALKTGSARTAADLSREPSERPVHFWGREGDLGIARRGLASGSSRAERKAAGMLYSTTVSDGVASATHTTGSPQAVGTGSVAMSSRATAAARKALPARPTPGKRAPRESEDDPSRSERTTQWWDDQEELSHRVMRQWVVSAPDERPTTGGTSLRVATPTRDQPKVGSQSTRRFSISPADMRLRVLSA